MIGRARKIAIAACRNASTRPTRKVATPSRQQCRTSDRRDAQAFGFPRGQNLSPAPTTIAIDAALLRVGSARGFLQARSYARGRLNKGGARPRIRNQVAGGLQKSLRLGSFCQNFRKDCKSNVLQSGIAILFVGIIHFLNTFFPMVPVPLILKPVRTHDRPSSGRSDLA